MQQDSLLMEVAGLEDNWVEVKRHTTEVFQGSGATLDEALSSEESQRLHVSVSFLVVDESCSQTALPASVTAALLFILCRSACV